MSSRKRTLKVRSFVASVCLALSWILIVHAQELQLGNVTYSRAAAPTLRMPVTASAGFFRGVGGVAFSAVAIGPPNLVVQSLRYDPAALDGKRLVIDVGPAGGSIQTVRGHIYDWQLVPIARYALDENGSAVTLFGRLENERDEQALLQKGQRVINYHPQLDNTLVGLRLFQADVLIIQPNATDLFKRDDQVILGAGESGHNVERNRERYQQISEWQSLMAAKGEQYQYQSYVVGDLNQRVTFAISNGALAFSGNPHWTAWQSKYDSPADRSRRQALSTRHNTLIVNHNVLVDRLNGSRQSASLAKDYAALKAIKGELETIEKQLEELDDIVQMPVYSRELSQRIQELDGINPVVYQTLKTVMHYRALFKHFQKHNGAGFSAFVKSLHAVPVRPAVTTPTIQGTL